MTLQGPELAIGRLHPEFAIRLESAIREARSAGLPFAGVFSAYRPPAFGVGGFSDKFNSLHTYGLAVDMRGIGSPGSPEAQLWHQIAAKNGVVCPYGPRNQAEWNHCQPTSVKIILAANPLRETVRSEGPFDLENMFEAGNAMIQDVASAADSLSRAAPTPVRILEAAAKGLEPTVHVVASHRAKRNSRAAMERLAVKTVLNAKVKPVQHAKVKAVQHAKAEPVQHAKAEPVQHAKAEPVQRAKAKPVQHAKAEPVQRAKAKPVQHAKAEPVQHAKLVQRGGGTRGIAVEEGHRKSKSGRV